MAIARGREFAHSLADLAEEVDTTLKYVEQRRSLWSGLLGDIGASRLDRLLSYSKTACQSLVECLDYEHAQTMAKSVLAIIDGQSIKLRGRFFLRVHVLFSLLDAIVRTLSTVERSEYSVEEMMSKLRKMISDLKEIWEFTLRDLFPDFGPKSANARGSIIGEVDGKVSLTELTKGIWTFDVSPPKDPSVSLGALLNSFMEYEVTEDSRRYTVTLTAYSILPPTPWGSEVCPTDFSTGGFSVSLRGPAERKMAFSVEADRASDFATSLRSVFPDFTNDDGHLGPMFFPAAKLC